MRSVSMFDVLGDNVIFRTAHNEQVGIRNLSTGLVSIRCLGGSPDPACLVNNNVVFIGRSHLTTYNTITGVWSGVQSVHLINTLGGRFPPRITSPNNTIYFGGAFVCPDFSNKVFSFTW